MNSADKWRSWRRKQRKLVVERSQSKCEVVGCPNIGQAWHHCFGRGNIVWEPWASHHALTTLICNRHHIVAHSGDKQVAEELRWKAIQRLQDEFHIPTVDWDNPVHVVRDAVRYLEEKGMTWDES